MIRRVLTSSGTSSASRCSASVFGRGEYLNENMLWYPTAAVSDRVSSKSASDSPGNPTIISVDSATSGSRSRMRVDQIQIALSRVAAAHRLEHARRTRLHRADAGAGRSSAAAPCIEEARRHMPRMRAGEPDALDAIDVVNRLERAGESRSRGSSGAT